MKLMQSLKRWCGAAAVPGAAFEGPDRRTSERFESVANHAELAWQHGEAQVVTHVTVRNVGVDGVLVDSPSLPPLGTTAWIRMDDPIPTEWYEAVVKRLAGADVCALKFTGPCPYDLYKAT